MRKKQLIDLEDKAKFESGFRVMNGEQEFVTYHQGTTLRVWYGDLPDHYENHWHAAAEIALPIHGDLLYTADGRQYVLTDRDLLFIPARITHSLTTPEGSRRNLILFDPVPVQSLREPDSLPALLSAPLLLTDSQAECGQARAMLFDMLKLYYAGGQSVNFLCYGELMRVFALFARARLQSLSLSPASETGTPESIRQALRRALDFVDAHFTENITLEEAAQAAGFSKFYFSRVFSQYNHVSFSHYLLRKRTEAASRLLCQTDIRLTDVAVQSGFTSLSTFNRVFRASYGCTPTEYRALYRPDPQNASRQNS